jgi:putative two-component system response regulator
MGVRRKVHEAPYDRRLRRPLVLLVDDQPANLQLLTTFLATIGCQVETATDGIAALDVIRRRNPDLVVLDINMPGIDGLEVCRLIKAAPATRLLPVVMVTGRTAIEDYVRALEAGADDLLTKPVVRMEFLARVRSLLRLKSLYDRLDDSERVMFTLAAAVEAKDNYTEAHTERVAITARALGERLGLSEVQLDALYRGGMVHDIGKLGIPDSILLKRGPLEPDERLVMRRHPEIGEQIVSPLRSAVSLRGIIRHHHENIDGSGYPDGLSGDEIPLLARIVAICDAYDALVNERPYRSGRSTAEAAAELRRGAGQQWDEKLIDVFMTQVVQYHERLLAG